MWRMDELGGKSFPAIDFAQVDPPKSERCPEQRRSRVGKGRTVCVMIHGLNSPVHALVCARPPPLDRRQARECEEALARLLQAVGDGAMLGAPVAKKGLVACFNAGVTTLAPSGLHRTVFRA